MPAAQSHNAWIVLGWTLLAAAGGLSIPLSGELVGDFGGAGGRVQIRQWMRFTNLGFLGLHAALLVPMVVAASLFARRRSGVLAWGAVVAVALAMASVAGALLLDPWLGQGPFAMDDTALQVLRAGVFLPPVVRAAAWLLLALAVIESSRRRALVCTLIAGDIAVCLWIWAATPHAVTAHLHPAAQYAPMWTGVFFVASAAFVVVIHRAQASAQGL